MAGSVLVQREARRACDLTAFKPRLERVDRRSSAGKDGASPERDVMEIRPRQPIAGDIDGCVEPIEWTVGLAGERDQAARRRLHGEPRSEAFKVQASLVSQIRQLQIVQQIHRAIESHATFRRLDRKLPDT